MVTITREEFKTDEVFKKLYELIKKNHKVSAHTEKNLLDNREIKDFCEEARHYAVIPFEKPMYVSYDVSSWLNNSIGASVRIDSIQVYDDFLEYTIEKDKNLHGSKGSFIHNIK